MSLPGACRGNFRLNLTVEGAASKDGHWFRGRRASSHSGSSAFCLQSWVKKDNSSLQRSTSMEDCGNKTSPLRKPNRTWSDRNAATARPLMTVAGVPKWSEQSSTEKTPSPTLQSVLLQSVPECQCLSHHSHSIIACDPEGTTPCTSMRSLTSLARLRARPERKGQKS